MTRGLGMGPRHPMRTRGPAIILPQPADGDDDLPLRVSTTADPAAAGSTTVGADRDLPSEDLHAEKEDAPADDAVVAEEVASHGRESGVGKPEYS